MYLLYVDESGDTGLINSPTARFVLSGFVVHELRWHDTLERIIQFRRDLRVRYGLKLREEIHSAEIIHKPGKLARIAKSLRLRMLRDVLDFQSTLPDVNIINVVVNKAGKPAGYDVFESAWETMIQRFHNTLSHHNFPGPQNPQDNGLLIVDKTEVKRLRDLRRRMGRFNPVPNMGGSGYRPIPVTTIVEDAIHRDSLHSIFIQLVDVNAYFLMQKYAPCKYVKKQGGKNYFDRLSPVLCTVASRTNVLGIVER
jgi:hypothetical protein